MLLNGLDDGELGGDGFHFEVGEFDSAQELSAFVVEGVEFDDAGFELLVFAVDGAGDVL